MGNACYIFLPLFFSHSFSQVATNFTFTPETSVILLLLKCVPSNTMKKLPVKIVEHKLEAFFDGIRRDVQLGHFISLSFQFLNNFPDLPLFTSLVFSNER